MLAAEKSKELKEAIVKLEEKFFKKVSKDEQDLDLIKARGEANMREESPAKLTDLGATGGFEAPDLPVGAKCAFASSEGNWAFTVEEGCVISGDIEGSIQGNKCIFSANNKDYEGSFINPQTVEATWTDAAGATGSIVLTLKQ